MKPTHTIYRRAMERALLDERTFDSELAALLAGPQDTDDDPEEWATDSGLALSGRRLG